jgi:hypothetical protein
VFVGQAQIHDDRVVVGRCQQAFSRVSVGGMLGHEAALRQRTLKPSGHLALVFNQ